MFGVVLVFGVEVASVLDAERKGSDAEEEEKERGNAGVWIVREDGTAMGGMSESMGSGMPSSSWSHPIWRKVCES
jgi:hypothetical protein